MNFGREIDEIKKELYSDKRLKNLFRSYLLDQKESKLDMREQLYAEGEATLPKLLTDGQQKKLFDIEGGYKYCLQGAFSFSFPRGLCAAFQQYYTDNTGENAFQDWVEKRLPTEPLVKFQSGVLKQQDRCVEYLSKLEKEVDEEAKPYISNTRSVWNERINGMLRYGFYLGYRCGLSVITADLPIKEIEKLEKKVLLTEFELKLTNTHWTQEILDDTKPCL